MKYYNWDNDKSLKLKQHRGISFEEIVYYISNGAILDIIENPNNQRYNDQCIFIIEIESYAYLVPFIETENEIFLKTIYPSRKATNKYLNKE